MGVYQVPPSDAIAAFTAAMHEYGLAPPPELIADGRIHRCRVEGDPSYKRDGAYKLHIDEHPAGGFGCWKGGWNWQPWRYSNGATTWTTAERAAFDAKAAARKKTDKEKNQLLAEAARQDAVTLFGNADPADPKHRYLVKKGIRPHGIRQSRNRELLVPRHDMATGELVGLQRILPDGKKLNLTNGRVEHTWFTIGRTEGADTILVGEGFATSATSHEITGHAAVVSFGSGNLQAAAVGLRRQHPQARIIILADDDWAKKDNLGLTKAREAALAADALVAVPDFTGTNRTADDSDFNDPFRLAGAEAVRTCIEAAVGPAAKWSDPEPLNLDIERHPYPIEALPDLARQAVEEVQLFVQCPVEMVAASALSALSIAAQPLIDVRRSSGLQGPTSLYYLTIADSGERKTSSDRYFMRAIYDFEKKKREEGKGMEADYAASLAVWEAQKKTTDAKLEAAAKGNKPLETHRADLASIERGKPTPPRIPRLVYADATQEKLLRCLATEWPAAAIVSNEAAAVFGAHAMGKDSVMRTLGALNVLWDGGVLPVDRVGSSSFTVRGARLSINLQVQAAVLSDFMASNKGLARGSGFLSRFLFAAPETKQGTRMFREPPAAWAALDAYNARIAELLDFNTPLNDDGSLSPSVMEFDREAKAMWVALHDQIEEELAPKGEFVDVRDVAAKAADNIARLAALFHVLHAENGFSNIGLESVKSAGLVVIWHIYQALRFLGLLSSPPELAQVVALDTWVRDCCRREGVTTVSTRTVQQFGPVRTRKALDDALTELAEHGRIKLIAEGKKRLIAVNPALLALWQV
jgi:putative DNA primase/helicase